MTTSRWLCATSFSLLCAALAAGCAQRTEVIIAVESDIPTLDRINIVVTSPTGAMQSSGATFGTGPMGFVRTLGVTWSSGPLGPFVATATGSTSGRDIVARTAAFEFVQGQTRVLRLDLLASCRGVVCGAGQTCGETGCRAQTVSSSELEPYNGTIASHDAGSATDGGIPPSDTGTDAFVPPVVDSGACSTPETCNMMDDDCDGRVDEDFMLATDTNNCGRCGNVCMLPNSTAPTCISGRCVIGTCDPGFQNCDGRNSTGCESVAATDVDNCGLCNRRCGGGTRMCCAGMCAASCP